MGGTICSMIIITSLIVGSELSAAPKVNEVGVMVLKTNGLGCPMPSTTKLTVDSDGDNQADFFQVLFNEFYVTQPGKNKKTCHLHLAMTIPKTWQFAVVAMEQEGYASIDWRHEAILEATYHWSGSSDRSQFATRFSSPFEDSYILNLDDEFGTSNWSKCGPKIIMNMKTTATIKQRQGTQGGFSILDMERQTGLVTQRWQLQWRPCSS